VADDDGAGGGKLGGTIKLPVIGPAKKKVVLAVGGLGAAFVLWRYYQTSQAGDTGAVAGDSDGDGFADGGTLPSVSGAVSGDNSYGQDDGSTSTTDSYGFSGTTNSQWTQYVLTQLTASDRWSYTDIAEALGQYLANKPLTATQQSIVQAAIAVANNPPEGSHPIVPGGNTPITVAPGKPTVTATTTTSVSMSWPAVAGAAGYRMYRTGVSQVVGVATSTSGTVGGLKANTSYTFQVAAFTASGQIGPKSAGVSGKTKAVTLKAPTGVRATSIAKTSVRINWARVAGADNYDVFINGQMRGNADAAATSLPITGLKANTSYSATVRADTTNQGPGPTSAAAKFKTKK
jgi:hypothetical protein